MPHRLTMLAAAGIVGLVVTVTGCGSGTSRPNEDKLASSIGAAWCQDTGYALENRLDGSKAEVYDCNMPDGSYKCVDQENGIAHDVTVAFRLSLQSAIMREQDKPMCAVGG